MSAMVDRELLDVRETAIVLGLGVRTIWRLIDAGDLPIVRFGRAVRIDRRDVDRLVDVRKSRRSVVAA